MYLALRFPHLALRACCVENPQLWSQPLALANSSQPRHKAALATCNPAAAKFHVHPGLSITRALARCPELQILEPQEAAARELSRQLCQLAQELSPDLEVTAHDTIILTCHESLSPERASKLRLAGVPLQFAFAHTPDTAHLKAVAHPRLYTECDLLLLLQTFRKLFDSPAQLRALHHTLSTWGLGTIEEFSNLPRPDLQERLGPQSAVLHDIATGRHQRLLTLHRPPKDYRLLLELDYGVETLPSLLLVIRNLLNTLCARLLNHQRVPSSLFLELRFDDSSSHHSELRIPEPTTEMSRLLPIIEAHLDGLTASSPVVALALDAIPAKPSRSQSDLFKKSLRDPNQFAQTLNQLSAILGSERLGVPRRLDTYQPDHFSFLPPEDLFATNRMPPNHGQPEDALLAPPLRRLRPPQSIQVLATGKEVPQALLTGPYPGPLSEVAGPFSQNGHWWEEDLRWSRKEWDARLHQGPLARIAHLPPHDWKLEGYY